MRWSFAQIVDEKSPELRKSLEREVVPGASAFAHTLDGNDNALGAANALKDLAHPQPEAFLRRLDEEFSGERKATALGQSFKAWCRTYHLHDPWLWQAALETIVWSIGGVNRGYTFQPVPNDDSAGDFETVWAPDWWIDLETGERLPVGGRPMHVAWKTYAARIRRLARRRLGDTSDQILKLVNAQLADYRVESDLWARSHGFEPTQDTRHRAGEPLLWLVQHQYPTDGRRRPLTFKRIARLQRESGGTEEPSESGVSKAIGRMATSLPLSLRAASGRTAPPPEILT